MIKTNFALFTIGLLLFASASSSADSSSAKVTSINQIKSIMCLSLAEGNVDSSDAPDTNIHTIYYFRNDTKRKAKQFLVDEYGVNENLEEKYMTGSTGYRYYLTLKGNEIAYSFIADWKASGTLTISYSTSGEISAEGIHNSKGWTHPMKCNIKLN